MDRRIIVILALLTAFLARPAGAETFRFTAAPRCPYACPDMAEQGNLVRMVRRVFQMAGADITIEFLPWQRAVATASHDPSFAGYLSDDGTAEAGFILSPPLMAGTLGLAVRRGGERDDVSPAGLRGLSLAVLAGNATVRVIDRALKAGRLVAYPVEDDTAMLRMLAAGRVDAAIVDADVFAWQLRNAPGLIAAREILAFNPVVLGWRTLHIAFAGNDAGRRARMTFSAGNAVQGLGPVQVSELQADGAADWPR